MKKRGALVVVVLLAGLLLGMVYLLGQMRGPCRVGVEGQVEGRCQYSIRVTVDEGTGSPVDEADRIPRERVLELIAPRGFGAEGQGDGCGTRTGMRERTGWN